MAELIKIRQRGTKASYLPETTHKDVIYFTTDTNEIYLNGQVYGGSSDINTSINETINTEVAARKAVDGIDGNTYVADAEANYISDATSLNNADVKLDTAIKANATAVANANNTISTVSTSVDTINGKIPEGASTTNKLATASDVSTAISTATGNINDSINSVKETADANKEVIDAGVVTEITALTKIDSNYVLQYTTNLGTQQINFNQLAVEFIKDGMLDNVELVKPSTKPEDFGDGAFTANHQYLKFTWNTAGSKKILYVDVNSLVDVYTAGTGITVTNNQIAFDSTNYKLVTVAEYNDLVTRITNLETVTKW